MAFLTAEMLLYITNEPRQFHSNNKAFEKDTMV